MLKIEIDTSAALADLAEARERLLELGGGALSVPEALIEAVGIEIDPTPAIRADKVVYTARVTNLDAVLRAAAGARDL